MNIQLVHKLANENPNIEDFYRVFAEFVGLDTETDIDIVALNEYTLTNNYTEELLFELDNTGQVEFVEGFNYRTDIVERSEMLFETPLLKPNISSFATGNRKNVTMAFIFKMCVVLNCSPNDLYNWGEWRSKVMQTIDKNNSKLTNDQIKDLL